MNIDERVKEVIKAQNVVTDSEALAAQSSFYEEMKRLGIIKKQNYNIPLIDTTGRNLCQPVSMRIR